MLFVYGDSVLSERTVRNGFSRFRDGIFDLTDRQRSVRPTEVDDDQLMTLVDNDLRSTVRGLAETLGIENYRARTLGEVGIH